MWTSIYSNTSLGVGTWRKSVTVEKDTSIRLNKDNSNKTRTTSSDDSSSTAEKYSEANPTNCTEYESNRSRDIFIGQETKTKKDAFWSCLKPWQQQESDDDSSEEEENIDTKAAQTTEFPIKTQAPEIKKVEKVPGKKPPMITENTEENKDAISKKKPKAQRESPRNSFFEMFSSEPSSPKSEDLAQKVKEQSQPPSQKDQKQPSPPRSNSDVTESESPLIDTEPEHCSLYRYILGILHWLDFSQWTWKDSLFGFFAFIASGLSVGTFFFDAEIIADFVAISCILLGFSSVFMQRTLTDLETMRELNQDILEQASRLEANNNLLAEQNQKLDKSGEKLKKAEESLEKLSLAQGMNLEELIKQVEDYQKIQENVKANVKDQILQTLISAVMDCDTDKDYVIGSHEIEELCARLDSIPMVEFNNDSFSAAMNEVGGSILEFSRLHLSDDVALDDEDIFTFLND